MKEFDIESYLDGSLDPAEKEALNHEIGQSPALKKQVEIQRMFTQHLSTQLLREQVADARAHKPGTQPRWIWIAGSALLIVSATYFFFGTHSSSEVPSVPTTPDSQYKNEIPSSTPAQPAPIPQETKAPPAPRPIAQNKSSDLTPPEYPSPNVRGANQEDKIRKALLDKIWYTDFPPDHTEFKPPFSQTAQLLSKRDFMGAFVRLEQQERKLPENDTLRFLKGYCLLEMGEGGDALRYFDQLELRRPSWETQLQWYRGLGLLLTGDVKKARPLFREMAATPGHPFRQQSQKALELLK